MVITIKEGDALPPFELRTAEGTRVEFAALLGERMLVHFFPFKDPENAVIAASLNAAMAEFRKRKITVLGICSEDERDISNAFPVMWDITHEGATLFGVWGKRTVDGRTIMNQSRATFLLDEDGKIVRIMTEFAKGDHAQEVLAFFS